MTLPVGITTCTVTIGPAVSFSGEEAVITGTVVADRNVVWQSTGTPVFKIETAVVPSASGGQASFVVPHVDQPGFIDASGNSITGWYYTFTGRATFDANRFESITKRFQVLQGQTNVDLDLVPDGPVIPGVTVPSATVNSVAGESGVVTADELVSAIQGPLSASIDEALVDFSPGVDPLVSPPVLGRIDIVTAGKTPITSKIDYLDAAMTISGVPGVPDYFGKIQIRGRGNYTWGLNKKPYKVKLPSKVSLMGLPAFDDWALLANHTDPSKINNALAFAMGAGSDGLAWTPRYQFAELWLNGDYTGLYQFTETVKRGTARVNVDKAGTTGIALTGGYMLEIGGRDISEGAPGFVTTNNVGVIYDDPDGTVAAQATYIQTKVQEFDTALYASTWLDSTSGYAKYIDRNSFIDWYIIEELASNQDSPFQSSCKLYRTRDTADAPGKFYMGPLWDFDIAFGSVINVAHPAEGLFTRPGAKWLDRMFSDPDFAAAVATRWVALVGRLSNLGALIDMLSTRVAAAALRDQARHAYTADWADLAKFKKSWLTRRINYLSTQFVTATTVPAPPTQIELISVSGTTASITWLPGILATGAAADYVVQYRVKGTTPWSTFTRTTSPSITPAETITGLTGGSVYEVQILGKNAVGTGPASTVFTVTPPANALPVTSGLTAFYDASAITGLADGAPVATWVDSSAGHFDATATEGYRQPAFKANVLNGKPVVRFTTDNLMTSGAPSSSPAQTIFAVMKITNTGDDAIRGSSGANGLLFRTSNGKAQLVRSNTADVGTAGTTITNTFAIVCATYADNATYAFYNNGAPDGTGSTSGSTLTPGLTTVLCGGTPGDFATIACYNRVLTDQERASVTASLGTKYGITVV